jgi:hypothetical protein
MTTINPSLFETEMRAQVAAAEARVRDATALGDPVMVEASRAHLDGLLDLARRNGLEIESTQPTAVVDLTEQPSTP